LSAPVYVAIELFTERGVVVFALLMREQETDEAVEHQRASIEQE
jgi:hypothetical protein